MWEINYPNRPPLSLIGHRLESTGVAWSSYSSEVIATCSDDLKVLIWDIERNENKLKILKQENKLFGYVDMIKSSRTVIVEQEQTARSEIQLHNFTNNFENSISFSGVADENLSPSNLHEFNNNLGIVTSRSPPNPLQAQRNSVNSKSKQKNSILNYYSQASNLDDDNQPSSSSNSKNTNLPSSFSSPIHRNYFLKNQESFEGVISPLSCGAKAKPARKRKTKSTTSDRTPSIKKYYSSDHNVARK